MLFFLRPEHARAHGARLAGRAGLGLCFPQTDDSRRLGALLLAILRAFRPLAIRTFFLACAIFHGLGGRRQEKQHMTAHTNPVTARHPPSPTAIRASGNANADACCAERLHMPAFKEAKQ